MTMVRHIHNLAAGARIGNADDSGRCCFCEPQLPPQSSLAKIIKEQGDDEGLWFDAKTAPEEYLQQELRRLHEVCEKYSDGWAYARKLDKERDRLHEALDWLIHLHHDVGKSGGPPGPDEWQKCLEEAKEALDPQQEAERET